MHVSAPPRLLYSLMGLSPPVLTYGPRPAPPVVLTDGHHSPHLPDVLNPPCLNPPPSPSHTLTDGHQPPHLPDIGAADNLKRGRGRIAVVGAGGVVVGGEAQDAADGSGGVTGDGDVVASRRDCRDEFLREGSGWLDKWGVMQARTQFLSEEGGDGYGGCSMVMMQL